MEIILLQDVRNLGRRGQVVKVRPGYGRNFLLPQHQALPATKGNIAYFEQQKKKIDAEHAKLHHEASEVASQLNGLTLVMAKRVGDRDTLYGSVTVADIAAALEQKGIQVDKRQLDLGGPLTLKKVGDHKVTIDLHSEVNAEITVSIVPADQ